MIRHPAILAHLQVARGAGKQPGRRRGGAERAEGIQLHNLCEECFNCILVMTGAFLPRIIDRSHMHIFPEPRVVTAPAQRKIHSRLEVLGMNSAELDASRARYFDLYHFAPVGYLTLTAAGLILEANLTATTLLGASTEALSRQPFSRFVAAEGDTPAVLEILERADRPEDVCAPHLCELRMMRADGSVFWAHAVVTTLQQIDGLTVRRVALSDISARKQAEEALRESEERYRLLFESAVDALFLVDTTTFRIVKANRRASEQYGYDQEELPGKKSIDLFAESAQTVQLIEEALANPERIVHAPIRCHRKKDGTVFPVEITGRAIPLAGQQVVFVAARDITRRKRIEAIMAARLRLLRSADGQTLVELLQATIDEAEALPGSRIGFYHFLEADQVTLSLQAWSTRTMAHECKAHGAGLHYHVSQAGVWTDCLRERQAVIHNDYAALPHRKGMPPGHALVVRQLVVPVVRGENVMALLGVGNKPEGYTAHDVEAVTALADLAWDIAERKRAEENLRESEERYRLLFAAATDAFFLIDAGTLSIVNANKRASEIYGYSRDELFSMRYLEISAEPEDSVRHLQALRQDQDNVINVPLRLHRKKDGTVFPVELTVRPIPLKGRKVVFIAARDISERQAAEKALRESEEQHRQEQEAVNARLKEQAESLASIYQVLDSVGLIVCDLVEGDARIRIFNSGAEKLFGWSQEEAIGNSIALIYPPDLIKFIPGRVERFGQGRPMLSFDMPLVRRTEERFPAVVSVHPFDCREGRFRKVVGVFRDISELKRIQLELEAMNEDLEQRVEQRTRELRETYKRYLHAEKLSAIGKLSASIAHEFNNPLQGILSVLKGLRKRAIMEEEDKALLEAAIGESDRIKELIRSLQEFNRPSSGRKIPMDMHKALDSMLLLHKNDFKGKRIKVEREYAPWLPQILAVPDQIKQVLLNLLANAADACQQSGGVITVSTRQDGDTVAVAIKDTGIGIKPEEMDLIFQPFYTTKPEVKGTGLGLSVSYGIVHNHGGEIQVTSQPGEGATFTVVLSVRGKNEEGERVDR